MKDKVLIQFLATFTCARNEKAAPKFLGVNYHYHYVIYHMGNFLPNKDLLTLRVLLVKRACLQRVPFVFSGRTQFI